METHSPPGHLIQLVPRHLKSKKNKQIKSDMGIAHPPRGIKGWTAGRGKLIAPRREPTLWVRTTMIVATHVILTLTLAIIELNVWITFHPTPLKGHDLLGSHMLLHVKGFALRSGLLHNTVLPAMANVPWILLLFTCFLSWFRSALECLWNPEGTAKSREGEQKAF